MAAVPGTHVHTADGAVPPLDAEHAGLEEDLQGIDPGVDQILAGLRYIALSTHTRDETQTLLASLAGSADGTDVLTLLSTTVARLMNPELNPCLRDLDPDVQKNLRRRAEGFTYDMASYAPRDYPADACDLISPYPALT